MEKEYFIGFYTKDCPENTIDCVRIKLDMYRQKDMKAVMDLGLKDHPLYSDLVAYVLANPIV